jgi:hypothetical protein
VVKALPVLLARLARIRLFPALLARRARPVRTARTAPPARPVLEGLQGRMGRRVRPDLRVQMALPARLVLTAWLVPLVRTVPTVHLVWTARSGLQVRPDPQVRTVPTRQSPGRLDRKAQQVRQAAASPSRAPSPVSGRPHLQDLQTARCGSTPTATAGSGTAPGGRTSDRSAAPKDRQVRPVLTALMAHPALTVRLVPPAQIPPSPAQQGRPGRRVRIRRYLDRWARPDRPEPTDLLAPTDLLEPIPRFLALLARQAPMVRWGHQARRATPVPTPPSLVRQARPVLMVRRGRTVPLVPLVRTR